MALLVASFYLLGAGYIGTEFFAKSDRGEFLVQIEMPKDASIEQTNAMTQKAEDYLKNIYAAKIKKELEPVLIGAKV